MTNAVKGIKGFTSVPLMVRVISAIDLPDGNNGCWIWRKSTDNRGYGQTYANGRLVRSHKAIYEYANGPVPAGLELDHLCKNKACCNPAHLEAVTHSENNRRGYEGRHKTHCKHGHEFTPENCLYSKNGTRHCRICNTTRNAEWRLKRLNAAK